MTADAPDPAEAARCRALWAQVALIAISDAELDPLGPPAHYLATPDFRAVLALSGLDPTAALERIEKMRRDRLAAARAAEAAELNSPAPARRKKETIR